MHPTLAKLYTLMDSSVEVGLHPDIRAQKRHGGCCSSVVCTTQVSNKAEMRRDRFYKDFDATVTLFMADDFDNYIITGWKGFLA